MVDPADSSLAPTDEFRVDKDRLEAPHQPGSRERAAAMFLVLLSRVVTGTIRFRNMDESGFFESPPAGKAIYCCWHNRLALCLQSYYRYAHSRNATRGMAAMVSASRDGAFLAAVLEAMRVAPVRGSSSRRGRQALLELTRWAERGYDLAITPDGPRGPRYSVQPGIISLAQVTGLPILPFSYHLRGKFCIRSWDRFQVPLPFARCELRWQKPVWVPREADDVERERLRAELERVMVSITED